MTSSTELTKVDDDHTLDKIWDLHRQCGDVLEEISTQIQNLLQENGENTKLMQTIYDSLKELHGELKGTLVYIS